MAGTINYDYDPNQVVYAIVKCCDNCNDNSYVSEGTVLRVRAEVLLTVTTVVYDIRLASNRGTQEFEATDVFATLNDAVTEYETRLS